MVLLIKKRRTKKWMNGDIDNKIGREEKRTAGKEHEIKKRRKEDRTGQERREVKSRGDERKKEKDSIKNSGEIIILKKMKILCVKEISVVKTLEMRVGVRVNSKIQCFSVTG